MRRTLRALLISELSSSPTPSRRAEKPRAPATTIATSCHAHPIRLTAGSDRDFSLDENRKPRTVLEKMEPRLVAGTPGLNRVMVDHAARDVCRAALIEPSWRGDWRTLVGWLDEGLDLNLHILPAIKDVVARQSRGDKQYRQPNTLRYFTAAIREFAKRERAAA